MRKDETVIVDTEIRHLAQQIEKLKRGQLCPKLFKKMRLQYGIYSIRGSATAYMARVRIPLGILRADQLDGLAQICDELIPARACHLTTRQDVQLYGIAHDRLPALFEMLARVELTSREASGNVVRNVTCCPWAGISTEEPFDITPYAEAVSTYLLRNPLTQLLPRKIKIAFEGCPTDHARTPIHDIGVVAALHNGERGFRIYAGGGLGPVPRGAQLIEPWTSAAWLLPTIEGILRIFERLGEREQRAKARLKFLVERMGWDKFQQAVLEERSLIWATQSGLMLWATASAEASPEPPSVRADPVVAQHDDPAIARWRATNVIAQKQAGYVSVIVRVPLGDITAAQLRGVARLMRERALSVRIMPTQNLLLRDVPGSHLRQVYEALERLGLARPSAGRLADVTRCPGADTCLSAITHPRGLAQALEDLCNDGLSALADEPIAVKISGCPNSCGHHLIADIGCFGMAVRQGSRTIPCYQLLLGGATQEGDARFGKRLVRVAARRTPEAIRRIVTLYAQERQPNENFQACVGRVGFAAFEQQVGDLTAITGDAAEADLGVDLGTTEPFTLDAGKGECAE